MRIFNMECCSHNITILDDRSWTSHPQQCHRMSIHSFLLQQLSTTTTEPARRNTIQSLCDNIKWHFWKRTHTWRWRLLEREQKHKYSHSSQQKTTTDIPYFHEWKYVLWSYHTTYHSWTHSEHSPQWFRCHSPVCCHLVFTSSDNESCIGTSYPQLWLCSTPDNSPIPVCDIAVHRITAHSREEQNLLHHSSMTWIATTHLHQTQITPSRMLQQKKISHSSTRWQHLVRRSNSR